MKIRHKLTLDLQQRSIPPVLHLKQGDCMTRELLLTLSNDGTTWTPPQETVIYQVAYCKMDRTGGCYDTLPDDTPACSIESNQLLVQLHPQMLTVSGFVICELRMLNERGEQLSTFSFFLDVEPAATANVESADYYRFTSLEQLRSTIGNPSELRTEEKASLVAALNELHQATQAKDILLYSAQTLTAAQQEQARENISASPATHTHNYNELKDQPVIPTSLPANGGNADTLNGKTAENIHQDAVFSALKSMVHTLNEAKESGEFDGKDGKTPMKGVDYFTESDKAEIVEALDIKEAIYSERITNNLFDGELEPGALKEDGSNNDSSGALGVYVRSKNYIAVEGGKRLDYNSEGATIRSVQVAQYNANKQFIGSGLSTWQCERNRWTNNGITLDANTRYIRFWHSTLDPVQMNVFYHENINEMFANPGDVFLHIPHLEKTPLGEFVPSSVVASPLIGKKIVYDGDSICIGTHGGGGYAKLIADKVGGFCENQAVGGARLVTKGSDGSYHSIVDNLFNLPTDADLYCFEGGVNDVWSLVPLGTYSMSDYTGAVDKTTICGALETIFRYCLSNFVGKPICFIITHKVSNINYENYKSYHDSAIAICNKYSIPYYDAYNESGLNGWNTAQNNAFLTGNSGGTPDGCHPNEEGYKRYYVPQLIRLFEGILPIA